ncbi:hypothetical protein GCM10009552_39190 [Rothia nasimurium]
MGLDGEIDVVHGLQAKVAMGGAVQGNRTLVEKHFCHCLSLLDPADLGSHPGPPSKPVGLMVRTPTIAAPNDGNSPARSVPDGCFSVAIMGYARANAPFGSGIAPAIRTEFDLLERSFAYVKDETR